MSTTTNNNNNSGQEYVFDPPAIPVVAINESSKLFPVHRIYCVGRNYLDHVKELGNDIRDPPIFFTKPNSAIVSKNNSTIPYPLATSNLHYEVELVICIGKHVVFSNNNNNNDVMKCVFGYTVGIDLTRRDLQNAAKNKGQPWDSAKAFDNSAPLAPITKLPSLSSSNTLITKDSKIWLTLNGEMKQNGTLGQMTWNVAEIIKELSKQFYLQPGDLIFTGTPSGVGPIKSGDTIVGGIDGLGTVQVSIE